MKSNPCNLCGGTDVNLVDGFYYCTECGTQDMTAQETIVERMQIDFGVFASAKFNTVRKKKKVVQMSEEWSKWHVYNFILTGLADELIALGAKPSFKSKALWIWSRFIQKFNNEEITNYKVKKNELLEEDKSVSNDDNDEDDNEPNAKTKKLEHIKHIKIWYIVTILYLALNMDQSHIKLSDVNRFIREGRLNLKNWKKFVPIELLKNSLIKCVDYGRFLNTVIPRPLFHHEHGYSFCRELNLGTLHIPDPKEIVNVFIKELCLPKDFRNLVHSLLEYIPFKIMIKRSIISPRIYYLPDFEAIAMAYVLAALKMCFGLDDDYEEKLSDVVDEINEKENHLKSYRIGLSEPTDRLFSFRDWVAHLEYRKIIVSKYYHPMAVANSLDSQNYLTFDCYKDITFDDGVQVPACELAHEILRKIPQMHDYNIIPKKLFPASVTPITTYTEFILPRINDPHTRLLLSEDFSRYSLKYACQKLNLKSIGDDTNIIIGVSKDRKSPEHSLPIPYDCVRKTRKVFIKDTDNKDWIHDYQKIAMGIQIQTTSDNEVNKNGDKCDMSNRNNNKCEQTSNNKEILDNFQELDKGENIFGLQNLASDITIDFSIHHEHVLDLNESGTNSFRTLPKPQCMSPVLDCNGTLHREEVIKELIYKACRKLRIQTPIHYQDKAPRKKKIDIEAPHSAPKRRKREIPRAKCVRTNEVATILAAYHSIIPTDLCQEDTEVATDALLKSTKSEICEDVDTRFDMNVVDGDTSPEQQRPENKNSENENENIGGNSIKETSTNIKSIGECYQDDPTIKNILDKVKLEDLHTNVSPAKTLMANNKKYDQLIENDFLSEYNYLIISSYQGPYGFEKELLNKYPNSFRYILKTCASLIEVKPSHLFGYLQKLERFFDKTSRNRVSKPN